MKAFRVALIVVGIICTAAFVFVRYSCKTSPTGEVLETETRIGFPSFSPWYYRVESPGGSASEVNVISLSGLCGIAALLSFTGYARMRKS